MLSDQLSPLPSRLSPLPRRPTLQRLQSTPLPERSALHRLRSTLHRLRSRGVPEATHGQALPLIGSFCPAPRTPRAFCALPPQLSRRPPQTSTHSARE